MRTAIYVHEPSTVTIRAADPSNPADAKAMIYRYHQADTAPAVGTHELAAGIYLILSSSQMLVTGLHVEVQVVPNNKDDWPDPKASVLALEPGADAASLKDFVTVAKDVSPDD